MRKNSRVLFATVAWCVLLAMAFGADTSPQLKLPRIDPRGIAGKLVICGGGSLDDPIVERFAKLAGGKEGKLVVIPTASESASNGDTERFIAPWKKNSLASITVLHAKSREEATQPDFAKPLKDATAVWFGGGQQSRIADMYLNTPVESELAALLARGGVIGGTSAGAAIMSRRMIAGGNPMPRMATGFDLLPEAVIDQHFSERNRKPRLLRCLTDQPITFGLGIDEGTAVVIEGRRMQVMGTGRATICLPASFDSNGA